MGLKRNRRQLGEAMAEERLVMARRSLWKADHLEGFVTDVASQWALLHVVREVSLNGWTAVRLDSIRGVEHQQRSSLLARLMALDEVHPQGVEVDITDATSVLRSAAAVFPVVTVFTEATDPDICFTGRPVRVTATKLHLLDISSDATWSAAPPRRIRLDKITRVDVGGDFETALHRVGGYPPVPT